MATSTGKKKTPSQTRARPQEAKASTPSATKKLALGTLSAGAIVGAIAAAAFAMLKLGRPKGSAEHVPTDLMGDTHPGPNDRAPEAFRPDPTAPIPEGERDAFRPALAGASAPTLVKGQARENEQLDSTPS